MHVHACRKCHVMHTHLHPESSSAKYILGSKLEQMNSIGCAIIAFRLVYFSRSVWALISDTPLKIRCVTDTFALTTNVSVSPCNVSEALKPLKHAAIFALSPVTLPWRWAQFGSTAGWWGTWTCHLEEPRCQGSAERASKTLWSSTLKSRLSASNTDTLYMKC